MRDVLRRITGPDAISLQACVVLGFVMLLSNYNSSGIDSSAYFWEITLAWALSLAAAFGWLWLAKLLLLRDAAERPLIWQTLLVFLVAYLLRALVFDTVIWNTRASAGPDLLYRLGASLPTFGFGLLICAYIVSLAREFSRNIGYQAAIRQELAELQRSTTARVLAHRTELLDVIQSTLRRDLVAALAEAPAVALERMRDTIEQVVRPVSRQLATTMPDLTVPSPPAGRAIDWSTVLRNVLAGNPLRPIWFALWTGSAAWSISISRLPLPAFLGYTVLVGVVSFLALQFGKWGWLLLAHTPLLVRAAYVCVAALGAGAAVNFAARLFPPVAADQPRLMFAYLLISLGIVWFIAVVTSLRRETVSSEIELERATRELREALVTVNTQLREQRLAISRALHGPVQDRLTVAAFKLSDAIAADAVEPGLLNELLASIERVIGETSEVEPNSVDVKLAVQELIQLWEGVVDISADIDSDIVRLLGQFPASGHTVAEVIREACANGVRHGGSTRISVAVRRGERPNTLRVTVENNGQPLSPATVEGVGSLLLDELTLDWHRESRPFGTTLTALVPLVS